MDSGQGDIGIMASDKSIRSRQSKTLCVLIKKVAWSSDAWAAGPNKEVLLSEGCVSDAGKRASPRIGRRATKRLIAQGPLKRLCSCASLRWKHRTLGSNFA